MNIRNAVKTIGYVKEIKPGGLDRPGVIKVEYCVGGKIYVVRETLKLKSEPIKLGFLTIGQRKTPKIGTIEVKDEVWVAYSPGNPARAHIVGNDGSMNCLEGLKC